MEKRKTNILLELIDDIIIKYPTLKNTSNKSYTRSAIEKEFIFSVSFRIRNIFTNQAYHITSSSQFAKYFSAQCLDVRFCELCIYLFEV